MWEQVGAGLHSCSGCSREYRRASLELLVSGPCVLMAPQEKPLNPEPTLLIFKVDVIPPALPSPSVAGRINWANRCAEGSISGRWLVTCWSVPVAGGSGFQLQPLSQALRTKVCAQILETLCLGDVNTKSLTNLEHVLACQQGDQRKKRAVPVHVSEPQSRGVCGSLAGQTWVMVTQGWVPQVQVSNGASTGLLLQLGILFFLSEYGWSPVRVA